MIEAVMTFDLLPNIDMKAYQEWVDKVGVTMASQPGLVEFRANRNMLGNPMSRTVTTFQSLEDWAKFSQGPWQSIGFEFRKFATNLKVELWGSSPLMSQPVRPTQYVGAL